MPEAVIYRYLGKVRTISFKQKDAYLPVQRKDGGCTLVKWGRREHEEGELPLGGWAKLNQLKSESNSIWHLYQAKPVKIMIDKFMEIDYEGRSRWYEVVKGQHLQGSIIHEKDEYRVYVVMIDPIDLSVYHYRWPHILINAVVGHN